MFKLRVSLVLTAALILAPATMAAWVEFANETGSRISSDPSVGVNDDREKDYAWGDVDKDGDTDLVVVRKQPFTSPGKNTNVLFLNQNGVLTDRTADFATDSSVDGDNGFLTPTNDRDVVLVDLDLDGWLDIVTATTISDNDPKHIGHPRIYMNKGCSGACNGTDDWLGFKFENHRIPAMESYSGQSGFNPRFCSVSAGDLTGDGYPELYFGDYDSSGAGGSGQPNGADYNDKLLINGGAANPGVFTDGTQDAGRFVGTVPGNGQVFEVSAFGAANAIADVNGDFINDIVKQTSLNAPTYVGVAYNEGDAPNQGFFDTYDVVNNLSPYHVNVGDLNNDNKLDMVITDDGADRYLLNQGGGNVPDFISFTFSFNHQGDGGSASDDGFGSNNMMHDLDKDGFDDIIIADVDVDIGGCSRRMHIYRNLGGPVGSNVTMQEITEGSGCQTFMGNPASCIVASIPSNMLEGVHDFALFDINGDGWDDMVLGRCNTTEIYMNVPTGTPAGSVGDDAEANQIQVSKLGGGQINLSWGDSCILDDSDYAVYEGRLEAPFDEHGSVACSTSGSTTQTLTPNSDSSYYLVVPNNGAMEGSYGSASNGAPRQQGVTSCYIQNIGTCE